MMFRNRKAQSTAEYAVVLSLVIAAAIGMQVYVKRGVQARIKTTADGYVEPRIPFPFRPAGVSHIQLRQAV